jgi:hypothetical protein
LSLGYDLRAAQKVDLYNALTGFVDGVDVVKEQHVEVLGFTPAAHQAQALFCRTGTAGPQHQGCKGESGKSYCGFSLGHARGGR